MTCRRPAGVLAGKGALPLARGKVLDIGAVDEALAMVR